VSAETSKGTFYQVIPRDKDAQQHHRYGRTTRRRLRPVGGRLQIGRHDRARGRSSARRTDTDLGTVFDSPVALIGTGCVATKRGPESVSDVIFASFRFYIPLAALLWTRET